MFRLRAFAFPVLILCCLRQPGPAQTPPVEAKAPAELPPGKDADDSAQYAVTRHTAKIKGRKIAYTATAGRMPLQDEDGKQKASVFFVAYAKTGVNDFSQRPVTFCFNGGPGSSSVWLHLGMVGPKIVNINDDATRTPPPYKLVPNNLSLLDRTDLVLIDPVSTGYSRAAKGEDPKQFHGYDEDIRSVGRFIHRYVTRNRRWESPKFLLGESYGTTRAAGLAGHLQDRYKMYLNGLVMVSSVIDFQTIRFRPTNDLPYILFLPSYTATAWYHKRLPSELQRQDLPKLLKKVEQFAVEEYTPALMKGAALPEKKRKQIAEKLARYTGLTVDYVLQADLRIAGPRFTKQLLRDRGRTVGRLDSRFRGIDRDSAGEHYEYDPSSAAINGPFGGTLNHYVRTELNYASDLPYEVLTGKVHPWNYKRFTNRYVSASQTLREAMTKNPHLKVFVANGYYDLATPYFASVYSYNHLGLDKNLRKNITMGYYRAGHMMYIHGPSLKQLRKDLDRFYDASLKR